jgi:hypothetical protein
MAAGFTTGPIKLGDGTSATGIFYSSTGLIGGTLGPATMLMGATQSSLADFAAGTTTANTLRVTKASDSPDVYAFGGRADTASASDTPTADSFVSLFKRLLASVTTVIARLTTLTTDTSNVGVYPAAEEYETVAASQTDQILGATGAAGDRLSHITVQPTSLTPGAVTVKDGSTTIWTFPGGANSVSNYVPFTVYFNLAAVTAWKITTGASVSVVTAGDFT